MSIVDLCCAMSIFYEYSFPSSLKLAHLEPTVIGNVGVVTLPLWQHLIKIKKLQSNFIYNYVKLCLDMLALTA